MTALTIVGMNDARAAGASLISIPAGAVTTANPRPASAAPATVALTAEDARVFVNTLVSGATRFLVVGAAGDPIRILSARKNADGSLFLKTLIPAAATGAVDLMLGTLSPPSSRRASTTWLFKSGVALDAAGRPLDPLGKITVFQSFSRYASQSGGIQFADDDAFFARLAVTGVPHPFATLSGGGVGARPQSPLSSSSSDAALRDNFNSWFRGSVNVISEAEAAKYVQSPTDRTKIIKR